MRCSLFVFLVLLLPACSTMPTSPTADAARARAMPVIETKMAHRQISPKAQLHLVAFKQERVLEAWYLNPKTGTYDLFDTYPICTFSGGLGPKLKEGDKQTPEGFYYTNVNRLNPNSRHHLSFNIGFPNDFDQALGRTGSLIMVHGGCTSVGCLAMGDEQIEEIYMLVEQAIRNGQGYISIDIYPFRITPENIERHAGSPHKDFWLEQLAPVYMAFEDRKSQNGLPSPTAPQDRGNLLLF